MRGVGLMPARTRTHHTDPRFVQWGARIRAAASATPAAVCWRDGLTLAEHERRSGRRLTWTAGHTRSRSTTWRPWLRVTEQPPPGDWLAPEVSTCNYSTGAAEGNRRRVRRASRRW